MLIFKTSDKDAKSFLYRLVKTSFYWMLFYTFFLILCLFLKISFITSFLILSPMLLLYIPISFYRSIYFINEIKIENKLTHIYYFHFNKQKTICKPIKKTKFKQLRGSSTYHKHYKLICLLGDKKLKQYPILDWTEENIERVVNQYNQLNSSI